MKNNIYIISVCIPVYNVSKYIERCARSLFGQTMTEGVEFLFINDFSQDDSIELLEKVISDYPLLKNQIRIVHNTQNMGVVETRKRAIREAKGEYLAWVDSDDWIEPGMIKAMWGATNNGETDIVVQNVYLDSYEDGILKETKEWKVLDCGTPKTALMKFYAEKHVPRGLPFQMSRRDLVMDAASRVHNVNYTEDTMMLILIFANARSCKWLEKAYYHYMIIKGSNSLTHRSFKTKEEWNRQVVNIDIVTNYLLQKDKKSYRVTSNYIKWAWKNTFSSVFDNTWNFWRTYKECYRDILIFEGLENEVSLFYKIKVWLIYNVYPYYWYVEYRKNHSYGRRKDL